MSGRPPTTPGAHLTPSSNGAAAAPTRLIVVRAGALCKCPVFIGCWVCCAISVGRNQPKAPNGGAPLAQRKGGGAQLVFRPLTCTWIEVERQMCYDVSCGTAESYGC